MRKVLKLTQSPRHMADGALHIPGSVPSVLPEEGEGLLILQDSGDAGVPVDVEEGAAGTLSEDRDVDPPVGQTVPAGSQLPANGAVRRKRTVEHVCRLDPRQGWRAVPDNQLGEHSVSSSRALMLY